MGYSEKVIDHYTNPRNVGSFAKGEENVGTGVVGAPECGDVMKLQLKINPENGVIEDAKFKTFGCGSAIASSSYVTELVKGKHVDEAMAIKNVTIVKELHLPPVKIHCSVLSGNAVTKIKQLTEKPEAGLLVKVVGGGCSGGPAVPDENRLGQSADALQNLESGQRTERKQ